MSIARKIAYNVIFNATTKVLTILLALVSIGLVTRYLGKDGFGEYSIALAFFSFFAAIADLGLYSIATREISRKDADERKIIGNVFALRLITALVVVTLVPLLLWFLPYEEDVKIAIFLVSIAFFFSSSYMVLNGIFQKNLAMDRVAAAELIGKFIQVGYIYWVIQSDLGFIAVISGIVIYMLFNFWVILALSRKYISFRLQFDFVFWKKFVREALPMGGAVLITFFYFKFDTILLSLFKSSEDVGIYNGAYKIIENITFFPAMIIGLILPIFSRYIFENKEKFTYIANSTLKVFMIMVVPIIIGGFLLAEEIVTIIGGEEFIDSAIVLKILIFSLGLIFFGHLFNAMLIVGNLQRTLMKILGICAIFNIGLNSVLIPSYSYIGSSITSVATELLVVILTGWFVYRKVGYTPTMAGLAKILLSGAVMGSFIILFAGTLSFFVVFLGSFVVYMITLFLTRVISQDEIRLLFSGKESQDQEIAPV